MNMWRKIHRRNEEQKSWNSMADQWETCTEFPKTYYHSATVETFPQKKRVKLNNWHTTINMPRKLLVFQFVWQCFLSCTDYIMLIGKVTVNNEIGPTWKEAAMTYLRQYSNTYLKGRGRSWKPSVRIASPSDKIWNQDLPNVKECSYNI